MHGSAKEYAARLREANIQWTSIDLALEMVDQIDAITTNLIFGRQAEFRRDLHDNLTPTTCRESAIENSVSKSFQPFTRSTSGGNPTSNLLPKSKVFK